MSEPFVGEIRMFAGNFAPRGWAFCDGQLLAVSQNDALFSLLGTIYGGDGRTTFGLPDMRGRIPIHAGTGPGLSPRRLGSQAGAESVTLTILDMPSHTHAMSMSSGPANVSNPMQAVVGTSNVIEMFTADTADVMLSSLSIGQVGGDRSHTNMMPYLCVNFIIALFVIYPSRQ